MRNLSLLALAGVVIGQPAAATTAYIYTNSSGIGMAFVTATPISPSLTINKIDKSVGRFDGYRIVPFVSGNGTAYDLFQTHSSITKDFRTSGFAAGSTGTPGFYRDMPVFGGNPSGHLSVIDLPAYRAGTLLYNYTSENGNSLTFMTNKPVGPSLNLTKADSWTGKYDSFRVVQFVSGNGMSYDLFQIHEGAALSFRTSGFPIGATGTQGFHQAVPVFGGTADARLTIYALDPRFASVPEVATWISMMVGFGLVGSALRIKQRARSKPMSVTRL